MGEFLEWLVRMKYEVFNSYIDHCARGSVPTTSQIVAHGLPGRAMWGGVTDWSPTFRFPLSL